MVRMVVRIAHALTLRDRDLNGRHVAPLRRASPCDLTDVLLHLHAKLEDLGVRHGVPQRVQVTGVARPQHQVAVGRVQELRNGARVAAVVERGVLISINSESKEPKT